MFSRQKGTHLSSLLTAIGIPFKFEGFHRPPFNECTTGPKYQTCRSHFAATTNSWTRHHWNSKWIATSKCYQAEECEWIIQSSSENNVWGSRIALKFTTFDTEHSANCTNDYMEIYDGDRDTAPLLGRFCGTEVRR